MADARLDRLCSIASWNNSGSTWRVSIAFGSIERDKERAAMLTGSDVVDVERLRISRSWQVAVLAAPSGPLPNVSL
jgi:hypothetical protein